MLHPVGEFTDVVPRLGQREGWQHALRGQAGVLHPGSGHEWRVTHSSDNGLGSPRFEEGGVTPQWAALHKAARS